MNIHFLEGWKPNAATEQDLMEGTLLMPSIFSEVLRVWDLTFDPD